MLFGFTALFAQEVQITGTVTSSEDGSPIPGVSVVVKGTNTGTATDINGQYQISAPSDATLIISSVGMKTVEVKIDSKSVVDATLETDVVGLEEVIVAAVASGTPRKKLTVSVEKVGAEELELVPASSAASALQGKVAGITVINSSGNPGQSAGIRLRGSTSLTGSQNPLIIIDGVMFEGELADVNIDDVSSIEVVKGASASALYGSRAGSGVLVITSKRGASVNEGRTQIRVRNEYGFQQLGKKMDLSTHHPYRLASDWESADNYTKYYGVTFPDGYAGGATDGIIGTRQVDYDGFMDNPYGVEYDYQDQIFTNGEYYTNYVSITNNSGKTRLFTSFENNKNEGIIWSTNGSGRQNFRVNIDQNITDKLKLSSSTMITQSKIDLPDAREHAEYGGDEAYGGGQGTAFFNLLFMEPDVDLNQKSPSTFLFEDYYYLPNPWSREIENPKHALYYEKRDFNRRGIIQNISASYELSKWLTASADYSFDRRSSTFDRIRPKGYQAQNKTYIDGQLYKYSYNGFNQTFTTTVNFNKQFGIVLAKAKFSYLYEDRHQEDFNVTGNGFNAAGVTSMDIVKAGKTASSSWSEDEIAKNYFGILDLDIKERYLISTLYRYDGSSLFGKNNRWNPYYRVSLGYRITEDIEIPGVQELKIRGSIGTSGQRPGYSYQYETYAIYQGWYAPYTIGNEDLKPSETTEKEIGLNAEFLKRFSLEVVASQNETKDAFVLVPLSGATGYEGQWRNAATLQGKSIEANLGMQIIKKQALTWNVNLTFDKVSQKVKELDAPPFQVGPGANEISAFYLRDGENFGIMYGYKWVTSLDEMANQLPTGMTIDDYTVNADGYVILTGTEGTTLEKPIYLEGDEGGRTQFKIADMNPDFNLSLSSSVTWKNLSFSMLWHLKKGGDIYNVTKQWLYRDNRHGDMDVYGLPENQKKAVGYYQALYSANEVNSHFVEDGTYLKLRELSLYYSLNHNLFQKSRLSFIQGMKFGILARNLLTFTNYSGWDPEVSAGGDLTNYAMDIFNYPNFRTMTFSLEFTF